MITGQTLGVMLKPAIHLALAYIVTRVFGYCKQTRPLPWQLVLGLWTTFSASTFYFLYVSGLVDLQRNAGFDPLHLLFTPLSLVVGFGIRQLNQPTYKWDGKRISQNKRKSISHLLSDLSLINTMMYVLLALSYWLMGASESAVQFIGVINLGFVGFIIGSFLYVSSYFLSLAENPPVTIEVRTKNWHFLEIFTIFVFFLFAPESIAGFSTRIKATEQTNSLLSEMRGNIGGTVIRIDSLSVKDLENFKGRLCVKASNKGQHPATNVSIQLARPDSIWFKDPNDLLKISTQLAVVDTLHVGETRTTCGNYTIATEKNDLKKFVRECRQLGVDANSVVEIFRNISHLDFSLSYTEDSEHRDDYTGRCEVARFY